MAPQKKCLQMLLSVRSQRWRCPLGCGRTDSRVLTNLLPQPEQTAFFLQGSCHQQAPLRLRCDSSSEQSSGTLFVWQRRFPIQGLPETQQLPLTQCRPVRTGTGTGPGIGINTSPGPHHTPSSSKSTCRPQTSAAFEVRVVRGRVTWAFCVSPRLRLIPPFAKREPAN